LEINDNQLKELNIETPIKGNKIKYKDNKNLIKISNKVLLSKK
jgi:hypothetical protein